jgi:hypothetical protein
VAAPAWDAAIFAFHFRTRLQGAGRCAFVVTQHGPAWPACQPPHRANAFHASLGRFVWGGGSHGEGRFWFARPTAVLPDLSLWRRSGGEGAGSGRFKAPSPAPPGELRLFWKLLQPDAPPQCPDAGEREGARWRPLLVWPLPTHVWQ